MARAGDFATHHSVAASAAIATLSIAMTAHCGNVALSAMNIPMAKGTRQRSSGALASMVARSAVPDFVGLESLEKEHFESVFGRSTLLA